MAIPSTRSTSPTPPTRKDSSSSQPNTTSIPKRNFLISPSTTAASLTASPVRMLIAEGNLSTAGKGERSKITRKEISLNDLLAASKKMADKALSISKNYVDSMLSDFARIYNMDPAKIVKESIPPHPIAEPIQVQTTVYQHKLGTNTAEGWSSLTDYIKNTGNLPTHVSIKDKEGEYKVDWSSLLLRVIEDNKASFPSSFSLSTIEGTNILEPVWLDDQDLTMVPESIIELTELGQSNSDLIFAKITFPWDKPQTTNTSSNSNTSTITLNWNKLPKETKTDFLLESFLQYKKINSPQYIMYVRSSGELANQKEYTDQEWQKLEANFKKQNKSFMDIYEKLVETEEFSKFGLEFAVEKTLIANQDKEIEKFICGHKNTYGQFQGIGTTFYVSEAKIPNKDKNFSSIYQINTFKGELEANKSNGIGKAVHFSSIGKSSSFIGKFNEGKFGEFGYYATGKKFEKGNLATLATIRPPSTKTKGEITIDNSIFLSANFENGRPLNDGNVQILKYVSNGVQTINGVFYDQKFNDLVDNKVSDIKDVLKKGTIETIIPKKDVTIKLPTGINKCQLAVQESTVVEWGITKNTTRHYYSIDDNSFHGKVSFKYINNNEIPKKLDHYIEIETPMEISDDPSINIIFKFRINLKDDEIDLTKPVSIIRPDGVEIISDESEFKIIKIKDGGEFRVKFDDDSWRVEDGSNYIYTAPDNTTIRFNTQHNADTQQDELVGEILVKSGDKNIQTRYQANEDGSIVPTQVDFTDEEWNTYSIPLNPDNTLGSGECLINTFDGKRMFAGKLENGKPAEGYDIEGNSLYIGMFNDQSKPNSGLFLNQTDNTNFSQSPRGTEQARLVSVIKKDLEVLSKQKVYIPKYKIHEILNRLNQLIPEI